MEGGSPVLRRRDAMGRARTSSPARRCGVVQFPDVIFDGAVEPAMSQCKPNAPPIIYGAKRNIANFEMRHTDTESEVDVKVVDLDKVDGSVVSASSESEEDSKRRSWCLDQQQHTEEGLSSASEGWSFQHSGEEKGAARCLQFADSQTMSKAQSVQELVEGAENLVRLRPKCAIESRDASGESDSDVSVNGAAGCKPRLRAVRPLSLCSPSALLPPSGARGWSASESALNRTDSPRKRRVRPRRKFNSLRKNQSGSDAWTLSPSTGSDRAGTWAGAVRSCSSSMVKSESFSGVAGQQAESSDSSTRSESANGLRESGDVTLVQGDDTGGEEFDESGVTSLAFRLGPEEGLVTATDSEKLGGEEPSSLNTEDCWDDYQEKYPSEAYSEEVADGKNLLDCDDYRQFLDCPSDTSRTPQRRRRMRHPRPSRRELSDTESEPDELRSLLDRSLSQLREVETLLFDAMGQFRNGSIISYEELRSKCKDNINCLKVYLDVLSAEKFIISDGRIRNVLDKWLALQSRVDGEGLGMLSRLEEEMNQLRFELCHLAAKGDADRTRLQSKDQLEMVISKVKSDLNTIRERKPQLQQLNTTVHRFIAGFSQFSHLKEEIIDLYRLWSTSFDSVSNELCELQQLSRDWQEFEAHLAQLHTALRADQDTLRMLDSALQCGLTGTDLAESVRDVAKVLSDRDASIKCGLLLDDPSLLLTEGSLSDSGISDSGSELELSEREKRLSTLKSLARHLEAILEPGSQALREMALRIEEAECELRGLQRTCREMMARSASNVKMATVLTPSTPTAVSAQPKSVRPTGKRKSSLSPVSEPPHGRRRPSWFWRIVRSALPFQLALVALLCVACLLEPQCCDAMNNLGLSHASSFRYIRSPPPV